MPIVGVSTSVSVSGSTPAEVNLLVPPDQPKALMSNLNLFATGSLVFGQSCLPVGVVFPGSIRKNGSHSGGNKFIISSGGYNHMASLLGTRLTDDEGDGDGDEGMQETAAITGQAA